MWKKALLLLSLLAFTVVVSAPVADHADAARKSFSSGKRSYTQTPQKSTNNVSKTTTGTKTNTGGVAGGATQRGFFSGGSLMRGLMIGGIAGLLFGSMFSGMGGFGDFLGLLVNVFAILILFNIIRAVIASFRRNKNQQRPDDSRRW